MDRYAKQRYRVQLLAQNPHCAYCHRPLRWPASLDHVQPRSRGGSDRRHNLVLACRACQTRKGNSAPVELLRWALRVVAVQLIAIAWCAMSQLRSRNVKRIRYPIGKE